jgi:hypothetical protein
MSSLTSFLPEIAPLFGLTDQAMYERQRSLVRMGLLPTPTGRGRGSGAEALPQTVALLIISCLATENLSEVDERVRSLACAPFLVGKPDRCPWTGATNFAEAMTFLLSRDAPIERLPKPGGHTVVRVYRHDAAASIDFLWHRRPGKGRSEFGIPNWKDRNRILITAEMKFALLQTVRERLLFGVKK